MRRVVGAVFPRGEHDQKAACGQIDRGESPVGEPGRVVRKEPALQVHRARTRIVDLDPIRETPILVSQNVGVVRHDFGYEWQCGLERSSRKGERKSGKTRKAKGPA